VIANLLSDDNGVGLSADMEIVAGRLQRLGFRVDRTECLEYTPLAKRYDVNVFLELFEPRYVRHARNNYIIPNQEWTATRHEQAMRELRGVLCKTALAQRLYRERGMRTEYIGFTSRDRCRADIAKDPRKWLHFIGLSTQKGTAAVLAAWAANPSFPRLTVVHDPRNDQIEHVDLPNIEYIVRRLTEREVGEVMNSHAVHLCPSETEGFGHSTNEALSCGAIVITTDAPPMNELVGPHSGFLVPYESTSGGGNTQSFTSRFHVSEAALAATVQRVIALPETARQEISARARDSYLQRASDFERRFDRFFGRLRREKESRYDRRPVLDQ
jgi:glycosyltransferase involved in cell wall biosynthesis